MNQSLRQLIANVSLAPQSLESDLIAYFNDINYDQLDDLTGWSQDILNYGSLILKSGQSEAKTLLLEQGWNPVFTELIKECNILDQWFELEMQLVRDLKYTPGTLFYRRAAQLGNKTLFTVKQGRDWRHEPWSAVKHTVEQLCAGLIDLMGNTNPRIAIFSENRLEVAYTDICCLTFGFVNVPIQPSAPPAQLEYILQHAEIEALFVSDSQHLKTLEHILPNVPKLKHIITYKDIVSVNPMVISFKKLLKVGSSSASRDWLEGIQLSVNLQDIASIMYTSGTTGHPKGIVFTYENIISKRFARSLAFNLGEKDRFLCFLPLFHTFGRFLEMWGSIFWGAEYTFSSGKGIQSLLQDLQDIQPSVLISIPKRWQDIYDTIGAKTDILNETYTTLHPLVEEVVGGNLRWGLSAAGYLPPEVFRFFQTHGIHLHSGYGMTEATGGITMTPTGNYIENSVGVPLPGVDMKLADDGELWIRGAYVSKSYWKPVDVEDRKDEWFTTGDIFQRLDNGQIEIIDRKKEIYKNAKGQTVAPQKIENMFRDFDSVEQLFIVGDHRPYNTALIYLHRKHDDFREIQNDAQELRDYVATVINSVNSFLAPFERIVDFHLVDREFDKDHGELTEKGTFKRSAIIKNFHSVIKSLYEKPFKSFFLGDFEVQIPNWVFLQRGWTQNDLEVNDNQLRHRNQDISLRIERSNNEIKVGSFNYEFEGSVLQFDDFIRQPAYCLGNEELEDFLDYSRLRIKPLSRMPDLLPGTWINLKLAEDDKNQYENEIQKSLDTADNSLDALKPIINLIYSQTLHPSQAAFRLLAKIYSTSNEIIRNIIRYAFLRLIRSDDLQQSQFAVEQVVALYPANYLERIVSYGLDKKLLFPLNYSNSSWANINSRKVTLAIDFLKWLSHEEKGSKVPSILMQNILGILHSWSYQFPQYFANIRSALISSIVHLPHGDQLKPIILKVYDSINRNFSQAMVDMESVDHNPFEDPSEGWDDILVFDKTVSREHQDRIYNAFSRTAFLNESMYLFFKGIKLSLQDLPPQGIWITFLRSGNGKFVYRATVQSDERSYKFVINLNDTIEPEQMESELYWLLACAKDDHFDQLVEIFGSQQPDYDIWSEEFIPGLTVKHYFEQLTWSNDSEDTAAPDYIWPHFLWTGIFTYTSFWKRTRFKKRICHPIPGKIIVPPHDYHLGGRLVSITGICDEENELAFLENLEADYAVDTIRVFDQLKLKLNTNIIYHAIREALGDKHSQKFFNSVCEDPEISPERLKDIKAFLEDAEENGFQAKSVYFATRRYHRWVSLNPDATLNAKAHFLKSLYMDYHVRNSEAEYLDARVQLFFWTVFSDANDSLKAYLSNLARSLRLHKLDRTSLQTEITQYININKLDEYEAFFLKRLAFPQLPPSEDIELIATRSTTLDDVEIMISRHDSKGDMYRIRRAMHPREINQLQRLFQKANLDVGFTLEHKFLVAINDNGRVIGGLFYQIQDDGIAYMDKVVVSEYYRGNNISRGLLDEFIDRMRNKNRKMIITGFLHPGYFYKFGFVIEKDQGGLVKYL